jgi:hypothetical protein
MPLELQRQPVVACHQQEAALLQTSQACWDVQAVLLQALNVVTECTLNKLCALHIPESANG